MELRKQKHSMKTIGWCAGKHTLHTYKIIIMEINAWESAIYIIVQQVQRGTYRGKHHFRKNI